MKVIAWYLPQFHEIPENSEWWGEGFTEWVNVKKAQKYHKKQYQPRVPLNQNYYCLLNKETQAWQIRLAKKYGIYGFCMHHYWFDGKLLLEKPVEQYLENQDLDFPFCLCWANEHWTNAWKDGGSKILIEQRYGREREWKQHFEYFLKFFKDKRYIKVKGKPLLVIYRPEIIDCLEEMLNFWQKLAVENGLEGLALACKGADESGFSKTACYDNFMLNIDYEPGKIFNMMTQNKHPFRIKIQKLVSKYLSALFHIDFWRISVKKLKVYSYDEIWESILKLMPTDKKNVPGAFVDWDCTPRKGNRGSFVEGASPSKFYYYFKQQLIRTRHIYKKDMLFIFAWNEWAESGYLEPDERFGHNYLKAIHRALKETNELE